MTWLQFVTEYTEWWSTVTFVVSAVFVLYYGIAAPWYRTPFGRALIAIDLGLAVATFPEAVYFTLGYSLADNRAMSWFVIVAGALVPIAVVYRVVTMWMLRNGRSWRTFRRHLRDESSD